MYNLQIAELPQESQAAILEADRIVGGTDAFADGDLIRVVGYHMIRGLPIREASKVAMASFAAALDSGERWLLSECCAALYHDS